ncbi:zinc finger protein [Pontoporia blainvillei]|uniref:Zinc finger protein n=1 Tax=Pontoporia blainvillei TaxID=48723 RepID=A0ABX0S2X0_PONBL|nr:zinc finger protein [Pontoporia blainvillei]
MSETFSAALTTSITILLFIRVLWYFQRPSPSTCDTFSSRRPEVASRITGLPPEPSQRISIVQQLHSPMLQTREGRSDTNHQKAKDLVESPLQADIVKFVHFLLDVTDVLSILSRVNQNRNSSIADIFATLESTLEMLRIYQTRPGPKECPVDSVTHFQGNCLLAGKQNISDVRNVVLTHLIKRLRGCFRDVNQDVVKAATTGSFKLWPAKINQEFGEKEVSILIAHYEPVLEAAKVKIDEVDTERSVLKLEIYARFQNIHKLTWDFVNSLYLHKYPNILTLVDLVLSLLASSAEAERGFSQMKGTKPQMHAMVKDDSMTDLLIIQLNSPDIYNFDPRKAIHLWNTRTPSSTGDTDLSRIVHQTQKGLTKAISNVTNVDLIIDHSKKNYFQKPES